MSKENVELVRDVFEAWERGDYSDVDWADPEIEFVMETPGGGTRRGLEAMRASWADFLRAWQDFRAVSGQFIDAGDKVLVLHEFSGHGQASGASIQGTRGAVLFTFDGPKSVRLVLFGDWDQALEAAGLRE